MKKPEVLRLILSSKTQLFHLTCVGCCSKRGQPYYNKSLRRLKFLLVARCSLLFARYSSPFARNLLLFARCLLFSRPNCCEIKLLWTAKKCFDCNETPPQIFSLQISEIFGTFSGCCFQSFLNIQNHFQSWHKVTNITATDITLMFLLQYLNTFLSFLFFFVESEVVARKSSIKKVYLNIPQNLQENICAGVSFTIKLQAEDL